MTTTQVEQPKQSQAQAGEQERTYAPYVPKPPFMYRLKDQTLNAIQNGTAAWQTTNCAPKDIPPLPNNAGKYNYSGASAVMLMQAGSKTNDFRTFDQFKASGRTVTKAGGQNIQYWPKGEKTAKPMVVHPSDNTRDVQGKRPEPQGRSEEQLADRHNRAEKIIENTTANIQQGPELRPGYERSTDTITLPEKPEQGELSTEEHEKNLDKYYDQALTQIVKSTGHESRMNREDCGAPRGSAAELRETIQTELAMSFISRDLGIPHDTGPTKAMNYAISQQIDNHPSDFNRASNQASLIHNHVRKLEHNKEQLRGQEDAVTEEQTTEQSAQQQSQTTEVKQEGSQGRGDNTGEERKEEAEPPMYVKLTEEQKTELVNKGQEKLGERREEQKSQVDEVTADLQRRSKGWKPIEPTNTFLAGKEIEAHKGAFTAGKSTCIPAIDSSGSVKSAMYINNDSGRETFAKGTKYSGCFNAVGGLDAVKQAPAIIVTAKYESAASISESVGQATVATFTEKNAGKVIENLKQAMPGKPVILAVDADKMESFKSVAKEHGAKLVAPNLEAEDKDKGLVSFNDIARSKGKEAIKNQLGPIIEMEVERAKENKNVDKDKTTEKETSKSKKGAER